MNTNDPRQGNTTGNTAEQLAYLLKLTYRPHTDSWGNGAHGVGWLNQAYSDAVDKLMPQLTPKQADQLKTHIITQYADAGPATKAYPAPQWGTIQPGEPGYIDMNNLPRAMPNYPARFGPWSDEHARPQPDNDPEWYLRPKSHTKNQHAENARAALDAAVTFCRLEEHTPGDVTDMAEQFLEWLTKQQEN